MVANMFGIVEMHSATTTPIKMTECSGGAPVTFISIGRIRREKRNYEHRPYQNNLGFFENTIAKYRASVVCTERKVKEVTTAGLEPATFGSEDQCSTIEPGGR